MGADRSNINRNSLNIDYIKIVVGEIVERYFNEDEKSLLDIIADIKIKYDFE